MTQHLVLTLIGDDKPGLVEKLSQTIVAHNGNWLESRLSHLADKFAGIVTVDVPKDQVASLITDLQNLTTSGLTVTATEAGEHVVNGKTVALAVVGNDKPGIVKEVAQVLHALGVNVKELETSREPAPMSSEMLFRAELVLTVPDNVALDEVEKAIEVLGSDLMMDFVK
ncbi:glycine cleavage system protein R [Maribrevibacterium harenarium]|uniref:Glycine cleavage system transcriptional repressor n=1 Tax=Maribrevibacterium harenarium TaxID=2589817 RepID=A0A501WL20_9GAMM|nr:ACT domain-containing protein [Maribrevibacterium harenarium]TPE47907.1 glycine cleavage system protein R [Maribrevibacterium harenarium]